MAVQPIFSRKSHTVPNVVESRYGQTVAVSSGHPLASQAAADTYAKSGNIVDAAIVGAGVLGTLLPYACGIGGDAYLLYYDARSRKVHALNGTGAAPSGATPDQFSGGMPGTGIHSCTVPGAVALWDDALKQFGTMSLGSALAPAIRYAREGFPVHVGLIENIEKKHELIRRDPEASRQFLSETPLVIGQPFRQTDLARVLETIAEYGAQEFYCGALAGEVVGKLIDAGGLFALDDFNRHKTLAQSPIRTSFYGHEILTMPPNSVGLHLLLQLRALQAAEIENVDTNSVAFWRATIAAWRYSLDVSRTAIGDPRDAVVEAEALLNAESISSRVASSVGLPLPAPQSGDTSNLVVMDAAGNAVSLVQSVSAPFASGIVLPGTGIVMNNRMRGFDNVSGSINRVGPGRRPKHTLVPALVLREGRAVMSIGTPGAAGQPLTLAQVLARIIAHGQDPAEAVKAPRWSVGLNNEIIVERYAPSEVVRALRLDENDLDVMSERHVRFGSVKIVMSGAEGLHAVADYRRVAGIATK